MVPATGDEQQQDRAYHYREQFGALGYLAEAAAQCGRADEARAIVAALDAVTDDGGGPGVHRSLALAHAILADGGDPVDDIAGEAPGLTFNRARILLVRGRGLMRLGRRDEARVLLEEARAGFAAAGAPPWQAQAERAFGD